VPLYFFIFLPKVILQILSPTDLAVNFQQGDNKISHHTSNIPPHLKRVATLPCEILGLISEKQQQPETCIMLMYHNEGYSNVIEMWWNVWPLLYYRFTAESVLKEFLKSLNIWKSYADKVDCFKCSVRRGTVLLKDEGLASDLTWRAANVVTTAR